MLKKKDAYFRLLIIAAIVVCINIIGAFLYKRADLTQEKRYSLSSSTKATLKNLDAPISITLYFSSNLPPELESWKQNIRNEVKELAANSNVPLAYDIVDPGTDPENELKAQRAGMQPQQINVAQGDQAVTKRIYIGTELRYKDKSDIIPYLQPGSNTEYQFGQSLRYLSSGKTFKLGIIMGHGEPHYEKLKEAWDAAAKEYQVDSIYLDRNVNLAAYKTLAIIEPTDSFSANDLSRLADYAMNGGNLLIATSMARASMQQGQAAPKSTNLAAWLQRVGIQIKSNLAIDVQCSEFTVPQQSGMMKYYMKVKFPYAPAVTNFGNSIITKGIQSVVMPFTSEVEVNNHSTFINQDILATTSDLSNTVPLPTHLILGTQWKETDFANRKIPLAWALTTRNSRWAIIGNGLFMVSTQKGVALPAQNLNFFLNTIDWLNDDTKLIELRGKGVSSRPLSGLTDANREWLKYLNMFLPIIFIVMAGIFRMLWQQMRQKRWKEGKL